MIRTNWGEGYQLSRKSFDHYIVDDRIMEEIKLEINFLVKAVDKFLFRYLTMVFLIALSSLHN